MFSTIQSAALSGLICHLVQVETDASQGLPCFEMIGFLGSEVREAAPKVRTALKNIGISLPSLRITVNLSPGDIRKEGTAFDLPIAIGILTALGYLKPEQTRGILFIGEIGLNGELRPVRGVLPIVREAAAAGIAHCIVPKANEAEGAAISSVKITGAEHLKQVLDYLRLPREQRERFLPCAEAPKREAFSDKEELDFADVSGQEGARRGAEIAAGGFHHFLMIGTPGAGKTMIAKRIPGILPPLSNEESLEVSAIYSVAGLLDEKKGLMTRRPFLSPHHTISEQALAGGGRIPRPGVVSLAHRSVLFLDELPEFKRKTLDILRQPLEDKEVHIARACGSYVYPADVMLVAAMNPCPCGYYPDANRCRCTPAEVRRYLGRVSGPILDRIDICVEASPIEVHQLYEKSRGESSRVIRERVLMTRERQEKRYKNVAWRFNAEIPPGEIETYCKLGSKEQKLLEEGFYAMGLSARAYQKVLKVARTIADMEQKEEIKENHIAEAMLYRLAEKKYEVRL